MLISSLNTLANKKSLTGKDKLLSEFYPAVLEVQLAPAPRMARAILWSLLAFLVIAIIWACLGQIEIVSVANGKLVPSGEVKSIQPLRAGVIKSIYVRSGVEVSKGQQVIALDATISSAELARLSGEMNALEKDIQRAQKILKVIEEPQTSFGSNSPLLTSVVNEYIQRNLAFSAQLKELQAEKSAAHISVQRYQKILPIIQQRVESLESLNKQALVAGDLLLQLQQQLIEHQLILAYEQARVKQIESSISTARQQQLAYIAEYQKQRYEELNQFIRQLSSIQQQHAKAQQEYRQQILVAPVDGVVTNLAINTIGGVVTPAQILMQIVPVDQRLIVEAGLQNKDIGFVTIGQKAEIKLDAFPFTKYGVIEAKISHISADAIEHEQLGLLFKIKADLARQTILVNHKPIKFQPGMQVSLEIITGKRRLIEFLLAPVLKGINEGGRER